MAIICITVLTLPIHEAEISMSSATAETRSPVMKSSRVMMRNTAQGEAVPIIISPKKPARVSILSASGSSILPRVVIWSKVRAM